MKGRKEPVPEAWVGDAGGAAVLVAADPAQGAATAAALIASALAEAAERRGRADLATTGGSTAPLLYRALLAGDVRDLVPWDRLHVWWGDDRFVRRGDPDSNVTALDEVLLDGHAGEGPAAAPLALGRLHPWPVDAALDAGQGPAWAAERLDAEMRAALPANAAGLPVPDVIVVGVGPDGHLLSVFPGSAAFDAPGPTAAVPAPSHIGPPLPRVTFTPAVLDAAPCVIVVAFGAGKAAIISRLLAPDGDPRALPARLARRPGATWILDSAAASMLPAEV